MKTTISEEIERELMLYDVERGDVFVLNPMAKLVYSLHKEGVDLNEIAEAARSDFSVSEDVQLIDDIENCIDELKRWELL